jgi:spore maturation protein CgeB
MRVGVIGPVAPDRFAENIGDALQRSGHTVKLLGSAGSFHPNRIIKRAAMVAWQAMPSLNEKTQSRIVKAAVAAGCEVVINVDSRLTPEAVIQLRKNNIKVALWFPDHVANLGRQLMFLAPYDALFFKEPQLVERVRAMLDLPVHYLPQACNPRWHRPLTPAGTEPYLVIAGGQYPSRVRLLERVIAKGIPLKIYGAHFPKWLGETTAQDAYTGQYLAREEKAKVFRSAVGVLNTMHPAEITGVNLRLFEAAGSGAAVLTEFRPTVPELFANGTEVLAYHDFDELVDQATRLFNEAGLTARLGDAAASRAHRDHTYDLRVAAILEELA